MIASDHFYDLQQHDPKFSTAIQRGETLTFFYTLPVALGPPILGSTPVSNVAYFNSRSVIRPIAKRLAQLAESANLQHI